MIVYLVYPKYQIISNSGTIYKLNKITGQITEVYIKKPYCGKEYGKYLHKSKYGKYLKKY